MAEMVDAGLRRLTGWRPSATGSGISTNVEQRLNLYHLLSQTVVYGVPGDVVELGCNNGQSAVLMRKVLDGLGSDKELHRYDSSRDYRRPRRSTARPMERATSHERAGGDGQLRRYGLAQPVLHRGRFADILPRELPKQVVFAHFGGDRYKSITDSLVRTYSRMSCGTTGGRRLL